MAEEIRAYRQAFLDSGDSMDGTGGLRRCENPADWLDENARCMKRETVPEGRVPATQFVYVRKSDGRIVGMIQVRHEFNDDLAKYGGHIGYSVRPDERRRGYASRMLQEVLPYCRTLGLDKVFGNKYVTIAIPLAIIMAVIVWIVLEKTKFGYELKATGFNRHAAKYCGMAEKRNMIITLSIGGAIAGFGAAMFYLTGIETYEADICIGSSGIAEFLHHVLKLV